MSSRIPASVAFARARVRNGRPGAWLIALAEIMNGPRQNAPNPPQIVYVSFSAEISPHTTESLLAIMSNCANQGVKTVYLLLSTPGGSVMNGLNIYNVLIGMPFELITHNVGNVDSIGNAIFLAGSKRYACPHSTFMFSRSGF